MHDEKMPGYDMITLHSEIVDVFSKVSPNMVWQAQKGDMNISKVVYFVKSGK